MQHTVLLIPGFFGFESIGNLQYFHGVSDAIAGPFKEAGHEVTVQTVRTRQQLRFA